MKVSVVTVNYKVGDKVLKCIKAIRKCNFDSYEIIIVDNEEESNLGEIISKKFKDVVYIKSGKNLGFGGGNNLGVKYAKGKYIFFLNPDTQIFPDVINVLVQFLEKNKRVGAVSPLLVNKNLESFSTQSRKELTPKNALFSYSILRKIFPKKSIYRDPFFDTWDMRKSFETDAVTGAALMISKKLFEKLGGFDENFFLYFEENDLSKRIRDLGYKLHVEPNAKVIHEVGQSTKNEKSIENIFKKSRFYYFKKHHGLFKALFLETLFSINKNTILISAITLFALFLRLYKIDSFVSFIGDQGWFFISARDMLLTQNIPLVGIPSSHVWLHQGPLWTYIVALLLLIFNFNPTAPFYFTALIDALTVFIIFKLVKEIFSFRTALFASILYAFSPFIILSARNAYHTSLIPFFVVLLLYSMYRWLKGDLKYFPFAVFNLFILYNLELQTSLFIVLFFSILFYGYVRERAWFLRLFNLKTIIFSLLAFTAPMLPILIYDYNNGFPQTFVFGGWILYKIYSAIPYIGDGSISSFINQLPVLNSYFYDFFQKLVYIPNGLFSSALVIIGIIYLVFKTVSDYIFKERQIQISLLFWIVGFLFTGMLINKTPSGAYLPSLFIPLIISASLLLSYLSKYKITYLLLIIAVVFIGFANAVYLIYNNYYIGLGKGYGPSLKEREELSKYFIKDSKDKSYTVYGKGEGSQFESFTANYQYLTWYYEKEYKKRGGDIIYIIEEFPSRVKISKIENNVKRSNSN